MCVLAACGSSAHPPAAPAVGPAIDARKAEKDARGLVEEIYQAIGRGQTDSLFSLLSDAIVVLGPRRTDATFTRSDALVALGKAIDPQAEAHAQLRSGGLEVVASEGGHSAWASDVIRVGDQRFAATAILSNTDDIWAVTAVALSAMPTGKQAKAEAARDAIVPPGAIAAAKLDPAANAVVAKFKKGLVEQQAWGDDLGSRNDAVVVGPIAGEVARGKAAIRQAWKARTKSNVREAISGEIAAAMTADGQLVWISAPVTRVADGEAPMPLRIFAVYEKDGPGWKMIALHEALAIDELGSGAPFKTIVPPAPPAPEPPKMEPTDEKPDDTVTPKKKKKKKKKKKSRSKN